MQPHHLLVFADDEAFCLTWIDPVWDVETLLAKDGIFFLEDLCGKLPIQPDQIRRDAQTLEKQGQCPWQSIGVKRIWGRWLWLVQMAVFAAYFQSTLSNRPLQAPKPTRFGPFTRKN